MLSLPTDGLRESLSVRSAASIREIAELVGSTENDDC